MDQTMLKYKRQTPYGIDVIMPRKKIPSEYTVSPITIEELFVFMVKEEGQ